jgi:hypothetical protein
LEDLQEVLSTVFGGDLYEEKNLSPWGALSIVAMLKADASYFVKI